MIAAALIPSAATAGIAIAWGEYRIVAGSLLLLLLTLVLINASAFAVLRQFYTPKDWQWIRSSQSSLRKLALVGTVAILVVLVGVVGAASYQQIAFERTLGTEISATLDDPQYEELELVAVRTQYTGGLVGSPERVTVLTSRTSDGGEPPKLASRLEQRLANETNHNIAVRVQFLEYQRSDDVPGTPTPTPASG
jgi:uncharacterized membrane protein